MPQQTSQYRPFTATPSQALKCLLTTIKARRPVMLWGQPGIGKSDMFRQLAALLDADLIDLRGSLLDAVDLRGLPMVDVVNKLAEWVRPVFIPREGCRTTLLVLDEINRSSMMVMNGMLQLALDRRVGEHVLPANVYVVAAGNHESEPGVNKMPTALKKRFVHVEVVPDATDWADWALRNDVDPLVRAFVMRFPHLLIASSDHKEEHVSPNPRAWYFVSEIAKQKPDRETERLLVAGTVGQGAAGEYLAFVELQRALPPIEELIANPRTAPVPTDPSAQYAVAAAMSYYTTPENVEAVMTYLSRLSQEYLIFALRDATNRDKDIALTPAFTNWAVENGDLLRS